MAVTSYRYQTDPGTLGIPGTPDVNPGARSTIGEYGGDALVTDSLVEQVLGLEPPPAMGKPFGIGRRGSQGGPLGPERR